MEQPAWIQGLFEWIQQHPNWTGILIFLFAFGESVLLVGIIIPGAAFLVALGTLVGLGGLDLYTAWLWSSLGGFAGDGLSFWIGHHYKERLLKIWPMYKFPDLIEKGQRFFAKNGGISVFIGRFVGPVRPVIPAIAGMMDMSVKKYIIISIIASILWAPFYLLPGILFGSALEKFAQIAGKLALLLLVLTVLIWLTYWLIGLLYSFIVPRTYRLLSRALVWSQNHPILGKITAGLVDPRQPEKGSLAMLAAATLLLSFIMIWTLAANHTIAAWNASVQHFFYAFHNPWTIGPMKWLLFIGHDLVILLLTIFIATWLLYRRLKLVLYHWLFISVSSYFLALSIHWFDQGGFDWLGGYHLTWLSAVIIWWASLVAGAYPVKWRSWPYIVSGIIILLVGFSALFFFIMELSTVIVSIAIGSLWALIVGIAFRIRNRKQFIGFPLKLICFASILVGTIFSWLLFSEQFDNRKPTANQINYPLSQKQTDGLLWSKLPLNITLQGNINSFREALLENNWVQEDVKTWGVFNSALMAEKDSEKLPIISSVYHGQIESDIFYMPIDANNIQVLRLWPENDRSDQWVGSISLHKRHRSIRIFNYWREYETVKPEHSVLMKTLKKTPFATETKGDSLMIFTFSD